ncbi:FH1/FH2 domain-containing protein 3-like [Oppia nitens]|uniref:FH1/FH2 domain-containing protein 3-like n=1 Tax=Oppia nitens TaxID=1686743 RepID=UPI0023DAE5BF|nr:FH1/FH2 domain-containing protein 3-like [Oppia nitens]
MKDEARNSLSLFISKCQDIDEMIGPTSPISPNQLSHFNSSHFSQIFERIDEEDDSDSVAVDVSDVKVHYGLAIKPTVEAYTEEIDSSAVRIRENKALSGHLSKISEEIEDNFTEIHVNPVYENSFTKAQEMVKKLIEKLLNSSGRELRRALFSLKQIFQDDKDLVHEFIVHKGLACLIKVGSEADQNSQNYILRALGQVMLYVDGMNGVIEHNETIQWFYTLISSQYRLVVKTALKLLLVFVEYSDSNCLLLVNSIDTVDSERGLKPWTNIMNIISEKDLADIELIIISMTLINKTMSGLPDQDSYYDVSDALEDQGMERIIQHYMSKQGTDKELLQQFRTYETVLRHEDGDDDGRPETQKMIVRHKSSIGIDKNRRKSRRHSFGTIQSVGNNHKTQIMTNGNKNNGNLPSWQRKVIQQTEQYNKKLINNNNNNVNTNDFEDIHTNLRLRKSCDLRQKCLIKEHEINQRSSISSCSSNSSADSYGSFASYGSYGSGEEKLSAVETIKILPPSMFDKNVDDNNKKNHQISYHSKQNITTNQWENNNNNTSFNNLNNNINSNNNYVKNDNSNGVKSKLNDITSHISGQYVVNKQTVNDKKWMISTYAKNFEEQTNLVNGKQMPINNNWNSNTNTDSIIENHLKSSNNVRTIKEKIMKPVINTTVTDPMISGSLQRLISAKESLSDPKCQHEFLQWDQIVNTLSRPLLINDLDFTDLRDDDDTDILIANSHVSNTPPFNTNNLLPPPPPPMCSTPPPPPLPNSGAITPPPPPFATRMGNLSSQLFCNQRSQSTPSPTPSPDLSNNSKLIPKNKKTIKLFWKEVKEDKSLLSRLMKKKTIWDEIKSVSVDTQRLEHLFESRAKELVNKKGQESSKKSEILVLDTKRSNAINIGMTKLPPPHIVKTAILKMDSTIMNKEGIEKILSTMMPTDDEKNKILEAQNSNPEVPLGSAEAFLLTLSSITALEARLRLWAFRLDYDSMEREVAEPLMDLKQATAELEKCESFRIVLGTLLAIGNFLNGVEVKGFQIDYLSKVPEVKDTVHKNSLLHHLCHIVMEKYPKSSDLYSELGAVSRASKKDFDEVSKSLQKMEMDCKASWEHLKVIAKHDGSTPMKVRMSEFLADCAERIIVLGIIHRRVINRFKKFLVFLGLPSHQLKETKPNSVLKIISEFALEYRTTRERVKEQLEKKAKHKEKQKQNKEKINTETNKVKAKALEADHELKQILISGSDYESEGCGGRPTKWGTLPGTKLRRPSSGSMTNLSNINSTTTHSRPPAHFRHSVNIEAYTEADDEIIESFMRTTTQPNRTEPRNRRKVRYERASSVNTRRTLKNGLDLSEEERLMLSTLST